MKFYKRTLWISLAVIVAFLTAKNTCSRFGHVDAGMQQIIERGGAGTLYIGSSMFRKGLDIYVLEENIDDPFLLYYNGNQPYAEYMELKYFLDNHCEIQRVIVDLYAYSASEEPWLSDNRLLFESDLGFKYALWTEISRSSKANPGTAWEMFVTANNELFAMSPIYQRLVQNRYYRGGTTQTEAGKTAEELAAMPLPLLGGDAVNARQLAALEGMIELCREKNIELCFLETPKYAAVANSAEYKTFMAGYVDALTKLKAQCLISESSYQACQEQGIFSEQVTFYSFNQANAEYYVDNIHMSSAGREQFTRTICGVK